MALGAVETATEGTEAVVVEVEEVSETWMNIGLVSLSTWRFRACLGGSLWPLVWQGGQGQEWLFWVQAVLLLVGVEEPIFPMWSGAPGQWGHLSCTL